MKIKAMRKNNRVASDHVQLNQDWQQARAHLADLPPSLHPDKTLELLNLCRAQPELRKLRPYISLGRLGLTHNTPIEQLYAEGKQFNSQDSPCLYYHEGRYIVAGYDNRSQWPFETAFEAICFVQRHLAGVPPRADYNVLVLPASLHALTLNWLAGTAEVSLKGAEGPVTLHLTGVTHCEALGGAPTGADSTVTKIEYDQSQLLIWLAAGMISVAATRLEIKK